VGRVSARRWWWATGKPIPLSEHSLAGFSFEQIVDGFAARDHFDVAIFLQRQSCGARPDQL
jgi:hypothetical protein